jgi:hypothetical protein
MALPLVRHAKRSGPFDLLLPGLYAWGVTVAWPASQRTSSYEVRVLAMAALLALVFGAGLAFARPLLGRIFGIWIFLLASVASWSRIAPALFLARLDPVQGSLGSLGWGIFAWSWARQQKRAADPDPEVDPSAPSPRQAMPPHLFPMLVSVAAIAALPMVSAWWVKGLERALVAHVVALAAAIALVSVAADFVEAGARGTRQLERGEMWRKLRRAAPAFLLLVLTATLGTVWGFLR